MTAALAEEGEVIGADVAVATVVWGAGARKSLSRHLNKQPISYYPQFNKTEPEFQ